METQHRRHRYVLHRFIYKGDEYVPTQNHEHRVLEDVLDIFLKLDAGGLTYDVCLQTSFYGSRG